MRVLSANKSPFFIQGLISFYFFSNKKKQNPTTWGHIKKHFLGLVIYLGTKVVYLHTYIMYIGIPKKL